MRCESLVLSTAIAIALASDRLANSRQLDVAGSRRLRSHEQAEGFQASLEALAQSRVATTGQPWNRRIMSASLERRTARAILLDDGGRVLLIRFAVARDGNAFVFWATPGGTVEPGETDLEAAGREIREELAIEIPLAGPVHSSVDRFTHKGVPVENTDIFFVGRLNRTAPRLHAATEDERVAMQETRWWSGEEMEGTVETIFPRDLATVVRRLIRS